MKPIKTTGLLALVFALALLFSASSSQAEASSTTWKRCGQTYLFENAPPVEFSVKQTSCFQGVVVFAHLLVDEHGYCNPSCELEDGWQCQARSGQGLNCSLGSKQIKATAVKRH